MVAEEFCSQLVFRVCDGEWLEQLASFPRIADSWCTEDWAGECLAWWDVANYVVPLGKVCSAFGVEEGFGGLAHAEGAEVVAAHVSILRRGYRDMCSECV